VIRQCFLLISHLFHACTYSMSSCPINVVFQLLRKRLRKCWVRHIRRKEKLPCWAGSWRKLASRFPKRMQKNAKFAAPGDECRKTSHTGNRVVSFFCGFCAFVSGFLRSFKGLFVRTLSVWYYQVYDILPSYHSSNLLWWNDSHVYFSRSMQTLQKKANFSEERATVKIFCTFFYRLYWQGMVKLLQPSAWLVSTPSLRWLRH